MEVINDLLNFNNLKIVQNPDWFSFSLDSVLLANFVKVNNKMKIIDFCCGNAPIPLILTTKTKSKIIGVELQKDIYNLAKKSIQLNNKEEQIIILQDDVKNLSKLYNTDTFDLITCNPPYFKYNNKSNTNFNNTKAIARHELSLELEDVFKIAKKILKNNGKLALVHRTDRLIDIICLMKKYNLEPKRIQFVYPFINSDSNLVLIEASKNGNVGLKIESNLVIHDENKTYTKEVLKIFNNEK